jgi:hypothetical protein
MPHATWLVGACLFAVALSSCGRAPVLPPGAGGAAAAPRQDVFQVPPDRSLNAADYIEAGLPTYDHPWQPAEMGLAAQVLTEVSAGNPAALPRFQSEKSGIVFARLVARDNLDLYANAAYPLEARYESSLAHLQGLVKLLHLYTAAGEADLTGDSELLELMDAQVRLAAVIHSLAAQVVAGLDRNDPRASALPQMQAGSEKIVDGCLVTLTERDFYRTAELKRFAEMLQESLPGLLPHLSPAGREKLLARLRALPEEGVVSDMRPELEALRDAATAPAR